MYVPLALRYRPQNFSDMVGQETNVKILREIIKTKKIPAGIILAGNRGTGKTTTSRIIAKSLNCQNSKDGVEPCDECQPCKAIAASKGSFVLEMDAASYGNVDSIRKIKEQLMYSSGDKGYRVYIIDECHSMTKEAWNAMLKMLEEPPPRVIFTFATTELLKVPDTIRSRCMLFEFKDIKVADVYSRMLYVCEKESIKFEPRAIEMISVASGGALRDALSMLDQMVAMGSGEVKADDTREFLGILEYSVSYDLINFVVKGDVRSAVFYLQEHLRRVSDVHAFFMQLSDYLSNLLMVKVGVTESLSTTADGARVLRQQSEQVTIKQILSLSEALWDGVRKLKLPIPPHQIAVATIVSMASASEKQQIQEKQAPAVGILESDPTPRTDTPVSASDLQLMLEQSGLLADPVALNDQMSQQEKKV